LAVCSWEGVSVAGSADDDWFADVTGDCEASLPCGSAVAGTALASDVGRSDAASLVADWVAVADAGAVLGDESLFLVQPVVSMSVARRLAHPSVLTRDSFRCSIGSSLSIR
jgi:hypothetical protein